MGRKSRAKKERAKPVAAPSPPVTKLVVDGRTVAIVGETVKPPGVWPQNWVMTRQTNSVFKFGPSLWDRFLVVLFTSVPFAFATTFSTMPDPKWRVVALAWSFTAVVATICGVRFFQKCVLDKTTGRATKRMWFRSHVIAKLADVVAVQSMYAGRNPGSVGGRGGGTPPFDVYQINLVLDKTPPERVNVQCEKDGSLATRIAKELATFLGVPLVDQIEATINACAQAESFGTKGGVGGFS